MYKLMVVDDEQLAIQSVKYIVEKEFTNISVSETAKSGREAIQKATEQKPDIILMDIRMPGINGIDAIQEIKKMHKDITFIIVSAYEHFEFAQRAVKLGVEDYLIKPVNKTRLVNTLKQVTSNLSEKREKYNEELNTKEKIEEMMHVVEHGFIYSLLIEQGKKTNISEYKKLFNIETKAGYIFVLKMNWNSLKESKKIELGEGIKTYELYESFKEQLKYKCNCIVGPVMLDRIVVYIAQSEVDEYDQRVKSIRVLDKIISNLMGTYNVNISIGIGSVKEDDNISQSYQEALKALNSEEKQKITHINDVHYQDISSTADLIVIEQEIMNFIEKGKVEQSIAKLNDLFSQHPDFFDIENLKNRLIELMIVVHRIAIEQGIESKEDMAYSNYINEMIGAKTKQDFEQLCFTRVRWIVTKIKKNKYSTINELVRKANGIIEKRYKEEVTLDDISRELCVSPQYFSRLYKDETGVTFIERLTMKRLNYAKELMNDGRNSIKQICYMCGYADPNYFSRLFKKHEGVSPSAYLKEMQS